MISDTQRVRNEIDDAHVGKYVDRTILVHLRLPAEEVLDVQLAACTVHTTDVTVVHMRRARWTQYL